MGKTVSETLHNVIHRDIPSPRLVDPQIPEDLQTICLKCLEKDPQRRYETAQEFAEELGRFLNDGPILARPISPWEKGQRWCRRKPAIAGLGAGLILVFCLGFAGTAWQLPRVEAKNEENRQQLTQSHVLSGVEHMQDGDYFTALLKFVEALRVDEGLPDREAIHRQRIASVMQAVPRLIRAMSHDGEPFTAVAYSPNSPLKKSKER